MRKLQDQTKFVVEQIQTVDIKYLKLIFDTGYILKDVCQLRIATKNQLELVLFKKLKAG